MNKKHIISCGLIILAGSLVSVPLILNSNTSREESVEEKKIDFEGKTSLEIRDYYTNEGLEFIKKIFPDSTASDFALLNVGKQLTQELKDIKFTTTDNKSIYLKDLKGKKVILDFALTNCSTCQSEASFISKHDFEKDGIVFLHIFPRESTQDIKKMIKDVDGVFNSGHTVSSTGTNGFVFEDLNITNVPAKLFIDENGIIQYTFIGGITDEETLNLHLERAFDSEMPKMLDYLK